MNLPHNIKNAYYITYGIFYLLGILTFIPTYFFITASRYWMFKFRFMGSCPDPENNNNIDPGPPNDRNILQALFPAIYHIISQVSLILFLILTAVYSKKLPRPDKRIFAALLCTLVFYFVNLIFCNLATDSFQVTFFCIVMLIASCLGICNAVILVSLFEMIRTFPSAYYSAILTGQALCGVISAIIQILTISLTKFPVYNGVIFFGIGTFIVILTIIVYCYSKKNSQYFIYNVDNESNNNNNNNNNGEVTFEHCKFFPKIWKKIKSASTKTKMCVSSLIIVASTTTIVYPGFMSLIVAQKSTGRSTDPWVEIYFVPVITFLLASLCDLFGRVLAMKFQKPSNQVIIIILAILRLSFLPLITLSNAQPRMRLPVLFPDNIYIIFTILFMFSNGYLINLCVALIPATVQNEQEKDSVYVMAVISTVLAVAGSTFFTLCLIYVI